MNLRSASGRECIVLGVTASWIVAHLLYHGFLGVSTALALSALSALALAAEWHGCGRCFSPLTPRLSGFHPGLHLGILTIPLLLSARLSLLSPSLSSDSHSTPHTSQKFLIPSGEALTLTAALTSSFAMLAATLLTWTWTGAQQSLISHGKEGDEVARPSSSRAGSQPDEGVGSRDGWVIADRSACGDQRPRGMAQAASAYDGRVRHPVAHAFLLASCVAGGAVLVILVAGSTAGVSLEGTVSLYDASWVVLHALACNGLLLHILSKFPGSFTAGEAMLLAQGLTLYAAQPVRLTVSKLLSPTRTAPSLSSAQQTAAVNQAMLLGLLFTPILSTALVHPVAWLCSKTAARDLVTSTSSSGVTSTGSGVGCGSAELREGEDISVRRYLEGDDADKKPTSTASVILRSARAASVYASLAIVVLFLAPSWLYYVVGLPGHPIVWVIQQVFSSAVRPLICLYWLVLILLPQPFLLAMASTTDKVTSSTPSPSGIRPHPLLVRLPHIVLRKAYHLLAVVLFTPALCLDPGFLQLAFGVASSLFILLELLRVQSVPPLADLLNQYLTPFTDSRDSGALIISHFSLLLGCALPVWLTPVPSNTATVAAYAGIITLGVGDTMASLIGVYLGHHRMALDCKKTVEGTSASAISMTFFITGLGGCLQQMTVITGWIQVMLITMVSSLSEAYTMQLDNAFIPLLQFALLCLVRKPT